MIFRRASEQRRRPEPDRLRPPPPFPARQRERHHEIVVLAGALRAHPFAPVLARRLSHVHHFLQKRRGPRRIVPDPDLALFDRQLQASHQIFLGDVVLHATGVLPRAFTLARRNRHRRKRASQPLGAQKIDDRSAHARRIHDQFAAPAQFGQMSQSAHPLHHRVISGSQRQSLRVPHQKRLELRLPVRTRPFQPLDHRNRGVIPPLPQIKPDVKPHTTLVATCCRFRRRRFAKTNKPNRINPRKSRTALLCGE